MKTWNNFEQEQAVRNIEACLLTAGSSLDKIISCRIFITDMSLLGEVDDVCGRMFNPPYPVSTAIGVASLAEKDALLELEMTAASD